MKNSSNPTKNQQQSFQTPKKLLLSNQQQQQPQTYFQTNNKSITTSNQTKLLSHNIFKKKYGRKSIKKVNLRLLNWQKKRLQNLLEENKNKSDWDLVKLQELDQVYVFIGRIQNIIEDRKYYHIKCIDQSVQQYEMYFLKSVYMNKKQKQQSIYINDIDSLVFQSNQIEGQPYFQFFVIFREIPIFQKSDEVLKTQQCIKVTKDNNQSQNQKTQFSLRKQPKIIGKQIRLYIEHIQKITDFNKITYHNLCVCYENLSKKYRDSRKMQIDQAVQCNI